MAPLHLETLLRRVRRRLWRGRFAAAMRIASWATIGVMTLATVMHWAWRAVRLDVAVTAVALAWVVAMAHAASRRPSDATCALWADRSLAGESAYSTLLEMHARPQPASSHAALRLLEQWAAARLPLSLGMLAQRDPGVRLRNALLPALACCVVGVLALLASPSRPPRDGDAQVNGLSATTGEAATTPATPRLPDVIAAVARASRAADVDARSSSAGAGKAPAESRSAAGEGAAAGGRAEATSGREPAARGSPTSPSSEPTSTRGVTAASAAADGREAGESRDDRTDRGATAPAEAGTTTRMPAWTPRPGSGARADRAEAGTFADDAAEPTGIRVATLHAPAADAPPSASGGPSLSPSRAGYVEAWMKAATPSR